jgi:tRNA threonylcarbamoyladenosine biosynthesis protein TsaB
LHAIAVTSGPGSYTGLRIGASTAKGLAYSLNIPLVAVGTLDVLAWTVLKNHEFNGLLCPMLDARRMEVYCSIFSADMENVALPVEAKVIDELSFDSLLQTSPILFFGPGATKCKSIIKHRAAHFLDNIYPSAAILGELASKRFNESEFEDLVHFEPRYLKDFVAKKSEKSILK